MPVEDAYCEEERGFGQPVACSEQRHPAQGGGAQHRETDQVQAHMGHDDEGQQPPEVGLHERHGGADQGGEYPEGTEDQADAVFGRAATVPENTVSQVRASPKRPSSLRTPARSTQAGAGAVP